MGILPRKFASRSWDEIRFRLRQEVINFWFATLPPHLPVPAMEKHSDRSAVLPEPTAVIAQLKTTPFASECIRIAEAILKHRFPMLGDTLDTGPEIHWRRDYTVGVETDAAYFRRVPYLDVNRAGDHKNIWELNRHQHLVLLAQAYLFSGRRDFLEGLVAQLESWLAQNPFQYGINWASALEVGFRALSWIWIHHLVGDQLNEPFRRRFLEALYRHGLHLEVNLSYYFAPNTHLLGEAVALHAIGILFPWFPHARRWQETGARVVCKELDRQVLADGCHFERSTYYHVYALDMFLFHGILSGIDAVYRKKLIRMAGFLDSILGTSETLPYFGDDDGGRFFHPYGARNRFGLATLATCGQLLDHPEWIRNDHDREEQAAWWLRTPSASIQKQINMHNSAQFADCGLVVMVAGNIQLIVDAGAFGPGNAGHSHADTLSVVLRQDNEQLLVDPGTYTYVGDPAWRERFRGTAAHNTVRIDGSDQAIPRGPFAWGTKPEVEVLRWESSASRDVLTAACSYAGFRHQRTIVFNKNDLWIVVLDRLEGPPAEHKLEQFWHFGVPVRQCLPRCFQIGTKALIAFDATTTPRLFEGGDYGWVSPVLGVKSTAPVVCVEQSSALPSSLATLIDLSGKFRTLSFCLHNDQRWANCLYDGETEHSLSWHSVLDSGV